MNKKIAVIGTGIMGHGIASNFLRKDFEVYVYNRDESKLKDLGALGAHICKTPKDAASQADIVFEVTANDESSRGVWMGDNGILAGVHEGVVLITCATLSIQWIEELAKECALKNVAFFDMPMTGSRAAAESGNLVLLVGGDQALLEDIKKDLAAISERVVYFGPATSGMKFKLILNSLQAIHVASFGEAMRIAQANGMDLKTVGDMISIKPGGTAVNMAWNAYQDEPEKVNFALKWITKDIEYTNEFYNFKEHENLDLFKAVHEKFIHELSKGGGDKDWTSINK